VSENRLLRRIFGPNNDKIIRGWRKLHEEEIHYLDSTPSIIRMKSRRMRWVEHVARMGEEAYRTLVGKPEDKIPLGTPRCGLANNIKMDLRMGYRLD
jgi:hypothetical protein